jgi:hypothetical protein
MVAALCEYVQGAGCLTGPKVSHGPQGALLQHPQGALDSACRPSPPRRQQLAEGCRDVNVVEVCSSRLDERAKVCRTSARRDLLVDFDAGIARRLLSCILLPLGVALPHLIQLHVVSCSLLLLLRARRCLPLHHAWDGHIARGLPRDILFSQAVSLRARAPGRAPLPASNPGVCAEGHVAFTRRLDGWTNLISFFVSHFLCNCIFRLFPRDAKLISSTHGRFGVRAIVLVARVHVEVGRMDYRLKHIAVSTPLTSSSHLQLGKYF